MFMYKLWKWSAMVFMLQACTGAMAYLAAGSMWAVTGAITIFPMLIALGLPERDRTGMLYNLCLIAATITMIVVAIVYAFQQSVTGGVILTMMGILAIISLALTTVREFQGSGSKDPILLLFIMALPLGVGVIVGGAVLLWRKYRDHTVPLM